MLKSSTSKIFAGMDPSEVKKKVDAMLQLFQSLNRYSLLKRILMLKLKIFARFQCLRGHLKGFLVSRQQRKVLIQELIGARGCQPFLGLHNPTLTLVFLIWTIFWQSRKRENELW